jgi:molecular chaperone GrpE
VERDHKKVKVKVNDKRAASASPSSPGNTEASEEVTKQPERDLLDDLKRVQAEFDNYRKRVMRDQENVAMRASAVIVQDLLPVLDNFERAISHSEGGEGVELVFKELKATLEREGLEEIPALGVEFDPNVHEAIESREQDGLEVPTVIEILRRGYTFKGRLLRAAMVVVGRPAETQTAEG